MDRSLFLFQNFHDGIIIFKQVNFNSSGTIYPNTADQTTDNIRTIVRKQLNFLCVGYHAVHSLGFFPEQFCLAFEEGQ